MDSDNHKTTHQDNIQRVSIPSFLLQMDTRGRGTKQQHHGRLQQKPRQVIGSPAESPPGLCLMVTGPHQDIQPIPSP